MKKNINKIFIIFLVFILTLNSNIYSADAAQAQASPPSPQDPMFLSIFTPVNPTSASNPAAQASYHDVGQAQDETLRQNYALEYILSTLLRVTIPTAEAADRFVDAAYRGPDSRYNFRAIRTMLDTIHTSKMESAALESIARILTDMTTIGHKSPKFRKHSP